MVSLSSRAVQIMSRLTAPAANATVAFTFELQRAFSSAAALWDVRQQTLQVFCSAGWVERMVAIASE